MIDPRDNANQLKVITDRILRLHEERDSIGADIREVYAEAKSAGFDKTTLGKMVQRLRAEGKDREKVEEADALLALYLSAYRGSPASRAHTHAHAREDVPAEAPKPVFDLTDRKPLRPHCQKPDECAGYGRNHCHTCAKAAGLEDA